MAQETQNFQCTQVKSKTVEEWWARKLDKARLNEITPDEIAMLELIRGIDSQKLRQEFLRKKEPTLEGLLQTATNCQRSNDVNKNLEATTKARKALNSSYQKNKADKWQSKATADPNAGGKPADTKAKCGYCGQAEHTDRKKQCKAYCQQCKKCNMMNHFQSVCLGKLAPNAEDKTNRVGRINVVCKRARVQDDSEPTPLMKDVKI